MDVLRHLQELERRRLFSDLGFSSLFSYAVKELRYSEDQALRRISAMRLLRELPEIEEKIKEGRLTLTNLAKAQTHFRHKKKSAKAPTEEKLELLAKLENKSSRETEKILLALAPTCQGRERIKPISPENLEFRFTAPAELLEKINELKALLAHSHPNASLAELFTLAVDLGIEHFKKKRSGRPQKNSRETPEKSAPPVPPKEQVAGSDADRLPGKRGAEPWMVEGGRTGHEVDRHIPAQLKREVWKQEKCENCGGKFALEIDHRKSFAMGGTTSSENLRLLCKSCNQRAAIVTFGEEKMEEFLN